MSEKTKVRDHVGQKKLQYIYKLIDYTYQVKEPTFDLIFDVCLHIWSVGSDWLGP